MSVPDFQTLMLPLLSIAGDGQEHSLSEAIDTLAYQFNLTEEDRAELLPSGRQAKLDNRVGWASTYLRKIGLLQSTRRGWFIIADRGLDVLRSNPSRIDLKFLSQYPEYEEFRSRSQKPPDEEMGEEHEQTPEEIFDASYQELRGGLAQELLEIVRGSSPRFFEKLVVDLLVAMGYGGSRKDAGQAVGRSGDGGIDGIIKEDRLGLDVVYIQAKRWEANVGRPGVQTFAGSLEGFRARKGVLITTSGFTQEAIDYASRIEKKIVLIGGEQLAQLMIDYSIGVNEVVTYTIKRIDTDYFGEE